MTQDGKPVAGSVAWRDLTVPDADAVRDFYTAVVGWRVEPGDMGGSADYSMLNAGGEAVAGVCHARGVNAGLPAQWLMYVVVEDLDASLERCHALGGRVVAAPRGLGGGRFCVIADPAGAVCALFQPAAV